MTTALLAQLALLGLAPMQGEDLGARIEAIRAEAGTPAIGAALVTLDGLQGVWVAGTRRQGGTERVTADDLWHLGSCTKSMTATLIALLVTRGDLRWETPIGDQLPEIPDGLDLDLLGVSLVELLCHRAGLAPTPDSSIVARIVDSGLPIVEQRARFTLAALARPPVNAPRGTPLYSNAGFIVAGHLAEIATGKSWEELMRSLLFDPLGLASAGFGPPGVAGPGDQPRGHTDAGEPVEPGPEADNPPLLGPAGTVHMNLADWARYVQLHLRGCREDVRVGEITLPRETFARLHAPYDGPGRAYGYGWGIEQRPWAGGDGTALTHNGSNTLWFCVTWIGPGNGVGVLVTANQASASAKAATDRVAALVLAEFERRRKAPAAR